MEAVARSSGDLAATRTTSVQPARRVRPLFNLQWIIYNWKLECTMYFVINC